jgi:hypothetical protein
MPLGVGHPVAGEDQVDEVALLVDVVAAGG